MFDITVDGGISIHAPQWGATLLDGCGLAYRAISIHAPQWGATSRRLATCTRRSYFNPRTPVGCDHPIFCRHRKSSNFNPRTPVGCDAAWPAMTGSRAHFNPRTPVGCDPANPTREAYNQISIHAPQWGATRRGQRFDRHRQQYFNPRTPVGCDKSPVVRRRSTSYFNPRTPVGCDAPTGTACFIDPISIHAPQWGATPAQPSTPPANTFQSTHPSGVRQTILPCRTVASNFNPRTPVGCDMKNLNNDPSRNVFQSTHPSGVRPSARRPVVCIHRKFQSTHPSGVRPFITPLRASFWLFQSTHPSGVRQTFEAHGVQGLSISIHAPQWGATGPKPWPRRHR